MDQLMKNEISLSEAERVASLPKEKQVERLKGEPEEVHPVTKKKCQRCYWRWNGIFRLM